LGLHARYTAEDEDSAIKDSKGAFDFDGEVDVARGVNDVDVGVFPLSLLRFIVRYLVDKDEILSSDSRVQYKYKKEDK
jgi:hypothetical protein